MDYNRKYENTDTVRVEDGWLITDTARYNLSNFSVLEAMPAYGYVKDHWLVLLRAIQYSHSPHSTPKTSFTIKEFYGDNAAENATKLMDNINQSIKRDKEVVSE